MRALDNSQDNGALGRKRRKNNNCFGENEKKFKTSSKNEAPVNVKAFYPPPARLSLPDLPDIPLEIIVKNLSHADLCNLALTNRRMKSFALNPNLFSDYGDEKGLTMKIEEKGMEEFLSVPRFRKIQKLTLEDSEEENAETLLRALVNEDMKHLVLRV